MSLDTTNNLLTLPQVRSYMGTTGSTQMDARLTELINVVSHRFNGETGRLLKSRSHTTYRDGNGKSYMWLDQYPITSDSTDIDIRIDESWDFTTAEKVGSTDIRIYTDQGKVHIESETFDAGEQSVKIVYTAGYTVSSTSAGDTGSMPYDLKYAACEMIQAMYDREKKGGRGVGVRSESVEGASITYEGDMPYSVRQVLDRYRDRRFG